MQKKNLQSRHFILPSQELYIITRMKSAHVMVCCPVRLIHLKKKKDKTYSCTSSMSLNKCVFNVDQFSTLKTQNHLKDHGGYKQLQGNKLHVFALKLKLGIQIAASRKQLQYHLNTDFFFFEL